MGLLDEAIREHLELKRRRGGDPTEIAREEREALDPVFPEAAAAEPVLDGHDDDEHGGPAGEEPSAQAPSPAEFPSIGEETAELDMQAVLDGGEDLTEEHHLPPVVPAEEEFEWEAPPSSGHGPPELDPGQERLSFE